MAVRLAAPDGDPLREVDSPSDDLGPEVLLLVAEETGEHRLEVQAFPGRGGRYAVAVAELRPATAEDLSRAAAAETFAAAEALGVAGDVAAAEAGFHRAGEAWRLLGDAAGQAHAEDRLGRLATRRQGLRAAADHHRRAALLFAAAGDGRWRGISLTLLGAALFDQGELRQAGRCFEEALRLRRAAGDTAGEATLLHNLGHVRQLLGEPDLALELYEESLARWQEHGDDERVTDTLHNLGALELALGRPEEALDRLREAESAAIRWGNDRTRTGTLLYVGRALHELGAHDRARASFERALALAKRRGYRREIGLALSDLGILARKQGDLETARHRHEEALPIFGELKDRTAVGANLTNLGAVDVAAGDLEAAGERFAAAYPYLAGDVAPWIRAENLLGQARVAARLGRPEAARVAAEAAVALVDSPRLRLGSLALTASYSATLQPYFEVWVDGLMALHGREPAAGWDRRALEAAERARARSFLAAAALAREEPSRVSGSLAGAATVLQRRLDALAAERLEHERHGGPPAFVAALDKEIRGALAALDRLDRRFRAADPRRAALTRLEPLTTTQLQRHLPPDAALIEIELGTARSYVWLLTADGVVSRELPGRLELESAAHRAYELLTRSHRREAEVSARRALCRVSGTLLGPLADALAGRRRLLIVAEGALLYLPFAALPEPAALDAGGCLGAPPLAAHRVVTQLPSASLLAALDTPPIGRQWKGEMAAVGDPVFASGGPYKRLPFSRQEAEAALALAPGRSLAALGVSANKEAVLSGRLAGFRRVHFATHALVAPRHPELSGLVLSTLDEAGRPRDGFLRAHEIAALDLRADLVVLSACRTALGVEMPGEGLVGLTRSFFEAGARSLLVSLWSVDDRSTAELMRRFYSELFGTGRDPAAALALAQASLASEPRWRAPYHWAGFVLQGPFAP